MNVRSLLLTVYETHFVPLGERLRPALNGFLSGVLPGMEEGSDHFDRTNKLLESVCEASHPPIFYGALWECVASNQAIRLPAITFVLAHIDRKGRRGGGDTTPVSVRQSYLLGNDMDVMVRAVCQAVQDSSVLVQRNALDLLLTMFPVHENVLPETDMASVVTAACSVLLRRDMSLNRRLFSWLLGSTAAANLPAGSGAGGGQGKKSSPIRSNVSSTRKESVSSLNSSDESGLPTYFEFYSRHLLIDGIKGVLGGSLVTGMREMQPDLKPFRLLVTLFDKAEIGQVIMDDVIIDVFRTLYHSYHMECGGGGGRVFGGDEDGASSASNTHSHSRKLLGKKEDMAATASKQKKGKQELIKSANLLFATFESSYIWDYCGTAFQKASGKRYRINDTHTCNVNEIGSDETSTVIEMCAIIDFLLDIVSIETYVETHSEHLPELFKKIMGVLSDRCDALTAKEITKALALAKKLLSKVQPAWNAWDVTKERERETSTLPEVAEAKIGGRTAGTSEKSADSGTTTPTEQLGNGNGGAGGGGGGAVDNVSPEVGREATESPSSTTVSDAAVKLKPDRQTSLHQAHENLMQECSNTFQDFFVRLMSTRIFPASFHVDDYVARMVRRPNETLDDRTRNLESLLEDTSPPVPKESAEVEEIQNEEEEEKVVEALKKVELPLLEEEVEELAEALATSCQILVDLSTVPTVSRDLSEEGEEGIGEMASAKTVGASAQSIVYGKPIHKIPGRFIDT
jgi:hypothetical protein